MKFTALLFCMISFLTAPLGAQTIMENPTACFGRDCYPATLIPATKRIEDNCYSIDGNSIRYDLSRPECYNKGVFLGSSSFNIDFGKTPSTSPNHAFALYSLEEIKNTIGRYGSEIRLSATFVGAYEACPSMDNWLDIGLPIQDSVYVSCGNTLTTIDFTIDAKSGRFQGAFEKDFGAPTVLPYKDFDLSKCNADLTVSYQTANICKLDVDLLEIVFQQK
ncbi:MAG TPA: hypothetical protein VE954_41860 [Oligoflexus sp.]|uniref:hypothetical protein n=1 Tax=Oligoflexus sp. TaxID=1971216 RepID=UPI002D4621F7|nr:hypothetical protein [Oligoflexus sp.]HYX39689.1 hypothetical protein [Oligoflexus sp.]